MLFIVLLMIIYQIDLDLARAETNISEHLNPTSSTNESNKSALPLLSPADSIVPSLEKPDPLEQQTSVGAIEQALPPIPPWEHEDIEFSPVQTPQSLEEAQRQENKLHANLNWDFCGPRPGVRKVHIQPKLTGTQDIPVNLTADRVEYDQKKDIIQLQGNVLIDQAERHLEAERASYDRAQGQVRACGNIYLESTTMRITGEHAVYNLFTHQGALDQVHYRLTGDTNLRGEASQAKMTSEQQTSYQNVSYTTCPPGRWDWSLKARDLELNQVQGMGTARHAQVQIAGIPIFYSPYLRFPIDNRRRSGFLPPTFGISDKKGTELAIPYYWNLAPNLDATITPRYFSMRGLQLGAEIRALTHTQKIELHSEMLPHDESAPAEGFRGALRINENGHWGSRWSTSLDYATVSDNNYLSDFGNRLEVTSIRNLSQRLDINYAGDGFRLLTRLQDFQTIDSSIKPADRPYGQLPHIELNLDSHRLSYFKFNFASQYDYFTNNATVHGSRWVILPSLSFPIRNSFGSLVSNVRLYSIGYNLSDQEVGQTSQPIHLIPSIDLDSKLIFERNTKWWGKSVLQTMEPRLYYVLTPYENQIENPLFDTTALDFSFASLFRPNRFTGYDRIGDENRLTVGITSRTIANQTGDELFRVSLGQIYYFDQRRVQLSAEDPASDLSSAIAGEFSTQLTPAWQGTISAQWNPNQIQQPWEKQVIQLRYHPRNQSLLNLAYRYNLGDQKSEQYEDLDFAWQMPLNNQIRTVGRWLYSLRNDETIETLAGFEFGRCCWKLRLLGEHLQRGTNHNGSTSILLQLELTGLGSFGNSIDRILEQGIYGYRTN